MRPVANLLHAELTGKGPVIVQPAGRQHTGQTNTGREAEPLHLCVLTSISTAREDKLFAWQGSAAQFYKHTRLGISWGFRLGPFLSNTAEQ